MNCEHDWILESGYSVEYSDRVEFVEVYVCTKCGEKKIVKTDK